MASFWQKVLTLLFYLCSELVKFEIFAEDEAESTKLIASEMYCYVGVFSSWNVKRGKASAFIQHAIQSSEQLLA